MSQPSDLLPRLEKVIRETLGANPSLDELQATKNLEDLVTLDSVATLEFAVGIEQEFGIRIEKENFAHEFIADLPRLLHYLQERTSTS